MRLRNNPQAKKILNESRYVISEKKDNYFNNGNEIHLEIGTGKGDFIIGMAKQYPKINFIGVEKFGTVLVKALTKLEEEALNNVLFLEIDAKELLDYFESSAISCIYINFSDPWPKKRHYKRRLTYKDFLKLYEKLLVSNGYLKQKTDNSSLFENSIMSFNDFGLKFDMISVDYHNNSASKHNVMSEYEKKFSSLGQPIYAVNVIFNEKE